MTTPTPLMTEHRKMQKQAEVVDALLSFVRGLETLDLTDEYVYQWLGIDTEALEREKQEAVNWVLNGGY